jgi:hypothetical protein
VLKFGFAIALFVAPGAVGNGLARLECDGANEDGLDAPLDAPLPLMDAPLDAIDAPVRLLSPFMPGDTCRTVQLKRCDDRFGGDRADPARVPLQLVECLEMRMNIGGWRCRYARAIGCDLSINYLE